MDGTLQIQSSVVIDVEPVTVWSVLMDSRLLPLWAPVVEEVTACADDGEAVGEVRRCTATMGRKRGHMVERCVELEPLVRVAYVVDEESFGMRRLFADYGFALNLASAGSDATRVTLQTHYAPRHRVAALLNAAMMRRRLRGTCDDLLAGLKAFAESCAAQ